MLILFGMVALGQAPPSELEAKLDNGIVELRWRQDESSHQPMFHNVYRSVEPHAQFSLLASVAAESDHPEFFDESVVTNTTYLYRVTTLYMIGGDSVESVPSNTAMIHTGGQTGSDLVPTNLTAVQDGDAIKLEWDTPEAQTSPTYYKVYRKLAGDMSIDLLASSTQTQYEDTAIDGGMIYVYRVSAVYFDSLESALSEPARAGGGDPLPPDDFDAEIHNGAIILSWDRPHTSLELLHYSIYRKLAEDSLFSRIGVSYTTVYRDSVSLEFVHQYYATATYLVQDTVESAPSDIITVPDDEDAGAIQFLSTPPHVAFMNTLYTYDAEVITAPPGLSVCFSLKDAPPGMVIDGSTGVITWTPMHAGRFEVEIEAWICGATDGEDSEQEFRLFVYTGNPGRIEGFVTKENGDPIGNGTVKLYNVSEGHFVHRAATDNVGHYLFPEVNPGTYYMRAKSDSDQFLTRWYNNVSRFDDATPVVLLEGASLSIDFTLPLREPEDRSYLLSGHVSDTGSVALGGVHILVFEEDDDESESDDDFEDQPMEDPVTRATTDGDGNFSLPLKAGRYLVGAMAPGYYPQFFDGAYSPLEADVIDLHSDTSSIDFELTALGTSTSSISGRVLSAGDSAGLPGLVVGFRKLDGGIRYDHFVITAHSDSTGAYELQNIPDGNYIILARPAGDYFPTFYSIAGGTPFLDSANVILVSGTAVTSLNIFSAFDSTDGLNDISGEVEEETPDTGRVSFAVSPLAGAIATISNATTGEISASVITGSDGNFMARGLAPGSYTVTFQKEGYFTERSMLTISYDNNLPTTTIISAALTGSPIDGQPGVVYVTRSWNLLSVPMAVTDARRSVLYPSAISSAYRFDAVAGYAEDSALSVGRGYWIKFDADAQLTISGEPRMSQSIPLDEGWNLIGSLSEAVPVGSATTMPEGIIASEAYEYDGGYEIAAQYEAGKGYWIKSTQTGTLLMSIGRIGMKPTHQSTTMLERLNQIRLSSGNESGQTLYFGRDVEVETFSMPPPPPAGIFDARFSSQRCVETIGAGGRARFEIDLQGTIGTTTVSWRMIDGGTTMILMDEEGRPLTETPLWGEGSADVSLEGISRLYLGVDVNGVPSEMALHQNYPNPFNPTTRIDYELSSPELVSLKIYNVLGEEVATLAHERKEPGRYTATWNAVEIPSGVYFYRLSAGNFRSVKKLLLIK